VSDEKTIDEKVIDLEKLQAMLDEHKKISVAIYQKLQGAITDVEKMPDKMIDKAVASYPRLIEEIKPELKRAVQEGARDASVELRDLAKDAHNYQRQEIGALWKLLFFAVIVFSGVGGVLGGVTVHYMMPKLNEDVAAKIQAGEFMQTLWPKLSKNEQNNLVAIAEDQKGVGKSSKAEKSQKKHG
jgi:hypothetical protein